VKDYARLVAVRDLDEIAAGEGRVVEFEGERCAIYRDESGELQAVSPICTHLKCIVHWNGAEKSWDCPCHGSRFSTDGSVIEGPAAAPLARIDLSREERRAA
jgi:Rieske Fe-S protein